MWTKTEALRLPNMSPEEKVQYVKDRIEEETAISPKGPIWYFLYSVGHPDNPDEWTILTRGEQKRIIKKLEQEKYIKNVQLGDDGKGFWLEKVQKRARKKKQTQKRRSNLYSHIKSTDQLLQERGLFEKTLNIIGSIKPKHRYKHSTYEKNDDLVQLLIDLELIEYDWAEIEKQTHREVGNRIIEFSFEADKIIALKNRVTGKGGRVRRDALELISKDIGERFTLKQIVQVFTDVGVPESMFIRDTKWGAVFYVLSYYTTSGKASGNILFLKILERVLHPLAFEGDEDKAKEVQDKYSRFLKYDGITIQDNKAYIGPTKEEWELGIDDWVSSDGEVVEPKSYIIFPDKVADLWVLWGQVVTLVSAYQNNKALDKDELEKLYLELIDNVEDLIENGKLGQLKDSYVRPFTSLATSEIEAKTKGAESPLDLISNFLTEITSLSPAPTFISKKMKERKELIDKVTTATRAISGDENEHLDLKAISYEQAVFFLKIVTGHIFQMLDAVSTGYINIADEQLNVQYIKLIYYFNELLSREDFTSLKEKSPEHLPEHLFEMTDEMDIWWSECGGQSGMMSFIGSIETVWIRTGQQTFPMPTWLVDFFNNASITVNEHRKSKAQQWERISKNIDEEAKKNGFGKQETKESVQRHEHTHRFENSIQEKGVTLNHKFENNGDTVGCYITKDGDDFHYKGRYLNLSKKTDYYKVFAALYSKLPDGGEITYKDLVAEIQNRLPKTKSKSSEEMRKFIQRNLTDRSNGFLRYAGIPETEDNGKPLIFVSRGNGIIFNNQTG